MRNPLNIQTPGDVSTLDFSGLAPEGALALIRKLAQESESIADIIGQGGSWPRSSAWWRSVALKLYTIKGDLESFKGAI